MYCEEFDFCKGQADWAFFGQTETPLYFCAAHADRWWPKHDWTIILRLNMAPFAFHKLPEGSPFE